MPNPAGHVVGYLVVGRMESMGGYERGVLNIRIASGKGWWRMVWMLGCDRWMDGRMRLGALLFEFGRRLWNFVSHTLRLKPVVET